MRGARLVPRAAEEVASEVEIAIAATFEIMDINRHGWRDGRARLRGWSASRECRASFISTRPDIDWKTREMKAWEFAMEAIDGARAT